MEWQKQVAKHPARFQVLRCGRRTGKTFGFIIDGLEIMAKYPNISLGYIGLTYSHAKDVVWEDFLNIAKDLIVYKHSQELVFKLSNGSRMRLYSWDSVDQMLGKKFHKLYLDEVAVARNFWSSWQNVIEPTLLDYNGEAVFASMPRGKGQFKQLVDYANKTDDWKSWHFTSYDNDRLEGVSDRLDALKKRLPASVFAQQYLAEFTDIEGRVYTEFVRDDAVSSVPFKPRYYGFSVDWGYNHPLGAYVYAVGKDDKVCVIKELHQSRLDAKQRESKILELVSGYDIRLAVGDSEDPIAIKSVNEVVNFNLEPAEKPKGSVMSGINTIKTLLHTKDLTIHERCVGLIDEMETYAWKKNKSDKETDEPVKENDDGVDSLRYFISKLHNSKMSAYSQDDYIST